ncbi:helicase-related protein [Thermogemmatispora sp.]|uniref:helicase-related protein n=1 Tax=Thermogemmatispora sp. TaxID=1968838 RepID=UPI0035E40A0C
MISRDSLVPNVRVRGLLPDQTVELLKVQWHGSEVAEVVYQDEAGAVQSELLFGDRLDSLQVLPAGSVTWRFEADSARFRLVAEAYRIRLAYLFDPLLAVHTSLIEPLPHQITAVYETLLTRQPLRYVLADDPGAGKTIMTGLLIKELQMRGALRRCLVVAPGNLVEQWQDELKTKFQLHFEILTNEGIATSLSGNPFQEKPLLIARLDKLARDENLQGLLEDVYWDLAVFDEAHKLSASFFGDEVKYTKRYRLGELVIRHAYHVLFLTATPHNGKEEEFQLFLRLLDPDRFEGRFRTGTPRVEVSDLMRHLLKEQLYTFEGKPLFPERFAMTVPYKLSPLEQQLYEEVTAYVREEFNRADALEGDRKGTVGFALTILQRRLASSPQAIYESLRRRRERLERRLQTLHRERQRSAAAQELPLDAGVPLLSAEALQELEDEAPGAEVEGLEEQVVDQATAARTMAELEREIARLRGLEELAQRVLHSGTDRKWEELASLFQKEKAIFSADGRPQKLVIFTEHRDTLLYLQKRITTLLGSSEAVVTIYGGMNRTERLRAQEAFSQDPKVLILLATDAAGEGINLQRAHLMVNYDLPWNPNRLEQRFGRIHRIGQRETCYLWNLVAEDTREGEVYYRLLRKLEAARKALGGQVFDVLGKLQFEQRPLRELIIEAIRYGDQPEVRARLEQVVEQALDRRHLERLLQERALVHEVMDQARVFQVREEMERAQARRLQPHFIASFFWEVFGRLKGRWYEREPHRYELRHVPLELRSRHPRGNSRATILPRYERITFEKELVMVPGKPPAELICPGHPLLEVMLDLVLEEQALLRQGTLLIDRADGGQEPRLLFLMEYAVQDGRKDESGQPRVVGRQLVFVERTAQGLLRDAGYAPFLDYEAPTEEESKLLRDVLSAPWLQEDVIGEARSYAIEKLLPRLWDELRKRREEQVERVRQAVHERLSHEIIYWDQRAVQLQEAERQGKVNASLNANQAKQRSDDLHQRLEQRMRELEEERQLKPLPPQVVGIALVVPAGLLEEYRRAKGLAGPPAEETAAAEAEDLGLERDPTVERRAMEAVMACERSQGHEPRDVSAEKRGYDIESRVPNEERLLFIEVKGRRRGAKKVFTTRNEVLTALNKPESFILALVLVDEQDCEVWYVKRPFQQELDFATSGLISDIDKLLQRGERLR